MSGSRFGVTRYYKNGKYIDIASDKSIISFGKKQMLMLWKYVVLSHEFIIISKENYIKFDYSTLERDSLGKLIIKSKGIIDYVEVCDELINYLIGFIFQVVVEMILTNLLMDCNIMK